MQPFIYLAIGLVLGAVLGWLLAAQRRSSARPDDGLSAELRQQLDRREVELQSARGALDEARTGLATARANESAAERLLADQRALQEKALADTKIAQEKAIGDLREAFKALSADALKQTHPEFIRLANETFAKFQAASHGEVAERHQAIATLVKPLEEHLKSYQQRLQQSETTQSTALGEVRKQLELLATQSQSLAHETQQFRMVLRSNQARGRWGEETLRRVVEAAGMSAHCDFTEQAQSDDKKPDLVVHLPGDRVIIVDSKVPDLDFLAALDANPATRAESLAQHAAKLRTTIRSLAERDYPSQFPNALDHVVLFLPAESLFSAALEGDSELIVWAAGRRIMLATPASLIALLRSVAMSWRQHAQTENAHAIAEAAAELFTRVATFTEHLERIGNGLENASKAFNNAVGSYDSRVRPAGEKLLRLGAATSGKALDELGPIETAVREVPKSSVIAAEAREQ